MTKYSDEFALQIRSESKYMTWKALSLKHKLSSNQVNYLLHKKRLTITTTTWLGSNAENKTPKLPPPKQKSKFLENFNALSRKIGLWFKHE